MSATTTRGLPPLLIVDDEKNMRLSLRTILADDGYSVQTAGSAEEAISLLQKGTFFLLLTDARLGKEMNGYELLARCRSNWPDMSTIMITAFATPRLAVEAIKAGAIDYLAKPFAPEELLHSIGRCAERYRLLRDNESLRARVMPSGDLTRIVGTSAKIEELRRLIQTVARSNATVLILGESGTGKELVAGAIHALSPRETRNYIKLNCAAIPETLLESELFGHEKGSFTGALRQKTGRVEDANGGTLFLDEIGDMGSQLQAKLLRFLEDGTFSRLGGTEELRVNVRIVAATNRDLKEAMSKKDFREDLYHRLNVVRLHPPPLRERREDIPSLVEHFVRIISRDMGRSAPEAHRDVLTTLSNYGFPGNVRELKNIVERSLIMCQDEIRLEHLRMEDNALGNEQRLPGFLLDERNGKDLNLERNIQAVAALALHRSNGNVSEAAKLMEIHRSKLNRILARRN